MKKNVSNSNKEAKQLKQGAKQEIKTVNNNPGYIMRTLNKIAQGKNKDAQAVEGFSREALKELWTRLNSTFNAGGFWWSSLYVINGRPVVSLKAITPVGGLTTVDDLNKVEARLHDRRHTLITFAGVTYLGTLGTWSFNAVINAAAARLQIVEDYIKKFNKLMDAQEEQERKAQERKERKEEATKAQELANKIATLKAQVAAGTITEAQAAAQLFAA